MALGDIVEYSYLDASAPVLTGENGAGLNVLRKILVDGYGAKPSQGWTEEFTATNKAVFRQPVGSNGFRLRIDDNNIDTARSMSARGYMAMTDVDTGTDPFPTVAQRATYQWIKSATASSQARPWYAIGDGYVFYLFVAWAATTHGTNPFQLYAFGDAERWNEGDLWMTFIMGTNQSATSGSPNNAGGTSNFMRNSASVGDAAAYVARNYAGTPNTADVLTQCGLSNEVGANDSGSSPIVVPSAIIGDNVVCPIYFSAWTSARELRGRVPGMFHAVYNQTTYPNLTKRSDVVGYEGTDLMGIMLGGSSNTGQRNLVFVQTEAPWR